MALWATGLLAAIGLACGPSGQQPPKLGASTDALSSGPTGAIFTTMPDGSVVNANVQYPNKLWVYLDGGPGNNAPQTAAGLDDGQYVFQVTDPSGKYLLSQDPSKCRVVEVSNGIITRIVPPAELGLTDGYQPPGNNTAFVPHCSILDAPDGAAGASGRHDTNVDADHGTAGAIVVQLMPFGTTPNPGGVYKAWMEPLENYTAKGGSLTAIPSPVRGRDAQPCPDFCAVADKGFGPPRNIEKTDNFKVKGLPPQIVITKYNDVNGNGQKDAADTAITGWLVTVGEPLFDGTTITNAFYTPASANVSPNTTVTVCEETRATYAYSYALVGTTYVTATAKTFNNQVFRCVDVAVGGADTTVTVAFGNYAYATKSGVKFEDLDADGVKDSGEPGLANWTINLTGTTGTGAAVNLTTTTSATGAYAFTNLAPGTYTASETCPSGTTWYQSKPCTQADHKCTCGTGKYQSFTLTSGQAETGNDFGNWRPASKSGFKFQINGAFDGTCDGTGETAVAGWPITLIKGTTKNTVNTGTNGAYAFTGLDPGTYTVCEGTGAGWYELFPLTGATCGTGFATVGYSITLQSGTTDTGNNFCNSANCVGLTPGYWSNWSNHYTQSQFLTLLQGTIAAGNVTGANTILNSNSCDGGDALGCMTKFLLATQLTLNLTAHPELPNPSGGDLKLLCQAPGDAQTLGYWLQQALAIYGAGGSGFSRNDILTVKTWLDTYANLKQYAVMP